MNCVHAEQLLRELARLNQLLAVIGIALAKQVSAATIPDGADVCQELLTAIDKITAQCGH